MSGSINPAIGVPPTIEWLPVETLLVDAVYQRSLDDTKSQRLIRAMAEGWDWRLYQPLSCARRGEEGIFVIDGQHRLEAARRRGDLPHLPCVVSRYDGQADEALAFAAMNRSRKAMSRLEHYRAAIAGGDPVAVGALQVISAAGCTLAKNENNSQWLPRQVACVGGIVRLIKQHGANLVTNALIALAEAYPDEPLQYAGTLLPGVVMIYFDPPDDFDPDELIAAIGTRMQDEWRTAGFERALASGSRGAVNRGVRDVILSAYQAGVARRARRAAA